MTLFVQFDVHPTATPPALYFCMYMSPRSPEPFSSGELQVSYGNQHSAGFAKVSTYHADRCQGQGGSTLLTNSIRAPDSSLKTTLQKHFQI